MGAGSGGRRRYGLPRCGVDHLWGGQAATSGACCAPPSGAGTRRSLAPACESRRVAACGSRDRARWVARCQPRLAASAITWCHDSRIPWFFRDQPVGAEPTRALWLPWVPHPSSGRRHTGSIPSDADREGILDTYGLAACEGASPGLLAFGHARFALLYWLRRNAEILTKLALQAHQNLTTEAVGTTSTVWRRDDP